MPAAAIALASKPGSESSTSYGISTMAISAAAVIAWLALSKCGKTAVADAGSDDEGFTHV